MNKITFYALLEKSQRFYSRTRRKGKSFLIGAIYRSLEGKREKVSTISFEWNSDH